MHPEQPSDPPLRRATLGGRTITWVDGGPPDGPCVVMIHGLPGSHRDFRWLAPPLEAAGVRVIRLDMPGFGGTEPGSSNLSRLAEHVLARLDQLELERVVVLGHSFGGPQALLAASRDPRRIRGLALLASVGLRRHRALRNFKVLPLINRGLATPVVRGLLMNTVRSHYRRAGFPKSTPDEAIRQSLRVVDGVDFRLINNALTAVRVPTLVAYCEDDRLIEPAITDELGAACPAGPRLRFASGGHNLQKSMASEIAEILEPWIRESLVGSPLA